MGGFVPFLPGDNSDLAAPESRAALERINADLGRLLRASPADFWATLLQDDRSIHDCLDSFLRYKRCGWGGGCIVQKGKQGGSADADTADADTDAAA